MNPELNPLISRNPAALCVAVRVAEADNRRPTAQGVVSTLDPLGLKIGDPCLVRGLSVASGHQWCQGNRIVGAEWDWDVIHVCHTEVDVEVPARQADGTASPHEFVIRRFRTRYNEIANPNLPLLPMLDAAMAREMIRQRIVLVPVCTRVIKMDELWDPFARRVDCIVWFPAIKEKYVLVGALNYTLVSYVHMYARGAPTPEARDAHVAVVPVAAPLWRADKVRADVAATRPTQLFAHDVCATHVFATPPPAVRAAMLEDEQHAPPSAARCPSRLRKGELEELMRLERDDPAWAVLDHALPAFECPCRERSTHGGHVYCRWFADPNRQ